MRLVREAEDAYRRLQLYRGAQDAVLLEGGKESRAQKRLLRLLEL